MYSGLLFLITWIRLWAKQISVHYMICVCVGGRRAFFEINKIWTRNSKGGIKNKRISAMNAIFMGRFATIRIHSAFSYSIIMRWNNFYIVLK